MKQLTGLLLIVAALTACQSADKKTAPVLSDAQKHLMGIDSANFTTLQWLDSTYLDLGKVKEGTVVEVKYRFKNAGDKALVIQDVRASCGCTIPEKPEQAFAPGEEGVIKAKFDSGGRPIGVAEKSVTVIANTTPVKEHFLRFKVEVTK